MPIDNSLDFIPINIAIITISDTRTKENDTSGDTSSNDQKNNNSR